MCETQPVLQPLLSLPVPRRKNQAEGWSASGEENVPRIVMVVLQASVLWESRCPTFTSTLIHSPNTSSPSHVPGDTGPRFQICVLPKLMTSVLFSQWACWLFCLRTIIFSLQKLFRFICPSPQFFFFLRNSVCSYYWDDFLLSSPLNIESLADPTGLVMKGLSCCSALIDHITWKTTVGYYV